MIQFIKKYKHGLVILIYATIYLMFFWYLERRPVRSFHVIDTVFDNYIPFCEYFIIPYLLWFPYQVLTIIYFVFFNKDKKEYYQLIFNLMMGMTVFLIVSYVYPNKLYLRPAEFSRDNLFTHAVQLLYKTDTPTNVLPSIHVFNSLAIHMSLTNCESLREYRSIRYGSLILTMLIILSTMFLKQHSVIDVCCGSTLALFGYLFFYPQKATMDERRLAVERLGHHRHHKRF